MFGHSYGAMDSNNMADGCTDGTDDDFVKLSMPEIPNLLDTHLGKARGCRDLERHEVVFGLASLLALLLTIGFSIYKLVTVTSSDPEFTFALLILNSAVFRMVYVIRGVLQERPTELFIFSIAVIGVIIYLYIDYFLGKKQDTVELARLIVASVCSPLSIFGMILSCNYYRSRRLIFRTVGANSQLQDMCGTLFFFFDFLLFDLQLSISMVILILTVRDRVDTEDIVVLSVGSVVNLVKFFLGYCSARKECKIGIILFLVSCLEAAYIIYKIVEISNEFMYPDLVGSTIACGAMSLIVRIIVIITAILVWRNFNQGLKEKVFRSTSTSIQEANVQGAPDEVH